MFRVSLATNSEQVLCAPIPPRLGETDKAKGAECQCLGRKGSSIVMGHPILLDALVRVLQFFRPSNHDTKGEAKLLTLR